MKRYTATLLAVFAGIGCSARDPLTVPVAESRASAESRTAEAESRAAKAESHTVKTESRPAWADRVDAVFAAFTSETPGCVVAVANGGQVLYTRGYGMAVLENRVPLGPGSVLDIGSTAKQVTASCIVLLSLEGKLSLDDPIGEYVPDLTGELATPTLRQLLTHTSGIRDYIGVLVAGGKKFEDWTTDEDALDALSKIKVLDFPPGLQFAYSNSNYFLLSQVVESVASRSLREFARERFFAPLAMDHTDYVDNHKRIIAHRASSYSSPTRETLALESSDWEQNGDGGLLTTAGDLVLWADNLTTGRVGGPAYVEAMTTRGKLADGKQLDYGFGLMFDKLDGRPIVVHAGGWAGFRAELLRVPSERLTVVCLANWVAVNPTGLAKKVARLVLTP